MWIFTLLIGAATFLAYFKILDAQLTLLPIITGFLGLLARVEIIKPSEAQAKLNWMQRIGISKPPPSLQPLSGSGSGQYKQVDPSKGPNQ